MNHKHDNQYDLCVIGGGINGVGIAADASSRGLKVLLCEQNDLASATSSASSKLIHGGLRYLEHYEFRLVREALAERETLLNKAAHLIKPQRFILPHIPHLRPAWMIRAGLFLYDHLSTRNHLPSSKGIKLRGDGSNPLKSEFKYGFEYSDCWVDDARLVITNALAAKENGADILVQTQCVAANRHHNHWQVTLRHNKAQFDIQAKALVNAAGPWAQRFFEQQLQSTSPRSVRLIKGSHIVIKKLFEGDTAYILQNEDGRVVFVIPYNQDYTLIGTTDKEHLGEPGEVEIDSEEKEYLIEVVNRHFRSCIDNKDIIWTYSGVRPLCDDESDSPSAITRDYTLDLTTDKLGQAPLLSVFGGKLTTYRRLALTAVNKLSRFFPNLPDSDTDMSSLPGGDYSDISFKEWQQLIQQQYDWLPNTMLNRMTLAYGTYIHKVLAGKHALSQLGQHFGANLYQAEVDYLMAEEWAQNAEDVLWRRSKLGLVFSDQETMILNDYMLKQRSSGTSELTHRKLMPSNNFREAG